MSQRPEAEALEQAERQRRRADAARVLPIFGAALIALPLLWRSPQGWNIGAVLVYLLILWALLIAASAALSRLLRAGDK